MTHSSLFAFSSRDSRAQLPLLLDDSALHLHLLPRFCITMCGLLPVMIISNTFSLCFLFARLKSHPTWAIAWVFSLPALIHFGFVLVYPSLYHHHLLIWLLPRVIWHQIPPDQRIENRLFCCDLPRLAPNGAFEPFATTLRLSTHSFQANAFMPCLFLTFL